MSEIKRVALNTLEPQKVNDKVIKKVCKTVRISVNLSESNEDNCPEYNYKDQLAAVVKKKEKVKPVKDSEGVENGLDPFGENDDDVRRIALEMEAKYGSGVTTKKKRKGKKDDYADIGMGYDESDSFIDNTDGYDEIIPQNVTTLHGGFYVNSGALVFKTDDEATSNASSSASSSSDSSSSSESEGEDKEKPKTKNRKRILDTSADSDSDTANHAQKEKKPKLQTPANSMQQAIKKKLFSTSKIQVKKQQRPIDPLKKTVKDLLREKREDLNMSVPDELKTVEDNIEKESSKENKKPMSITSVTDAIESVLKQVVDEGECDKTPVKSPPEVASVVLAQNKNDTQSKEKDNKQNLTRLEKEEVVKLPELPADIEAIVSSLKEAALNYKGEGKKAFFTKEVNALLLNLEKKSRSVSKSSRVRVYEHLSQYVNCTKDTLRRRARILDLEDNERRLKSLQVKLKDAIDAMMPELNENFQRESQKVLEKKFSKESENNEELKALKMPRRKFIWNDETKKLLKDILSVKKRCFVLEGKHKDNLLEEQVVDYLRSEIVPLWPEGWMYLNVLKKILNRMQDASKSAVSNSSVSAISSISSSLSNSISTSTHKHSNLSITPVTNGKSSTDKPEITNSITVTKVVNSSEVNVGDSVKSSTKSSEKNHVATPQVVKENDVSNPLEVESMYKDYVSKYSKSQENPAPKADSKEKTSDLSVFKPYMEEPAAFSQTKNVSDMSKPKTYSKPPKQTEMFKPYADTEIISVDKNIPNKAKNEENCLTVADVITSYPEQDLLFGHSHSDKEKHGGHSYSEKEKHGAPVEFEKDKYSSHMYSAKEEHLPRTYSEREKHTSHPYSDKDKHTPGIYPEKEKHSSHTYPEKDKPTSHTHSEKDKHSSHTYAEKDKHTSHQYSDKDKHTTHSYSEKDKHTYSDKDKHTYSDKDKHTYSDKEKHTYSDKDKHIYSDKEKHTYSEKDKHTLHSYSEREKLNLISYSSDKEKHPIRTYSEKDKHTYSEKDKLSLHSYAEKDKHSLHNYAEKDKLTVHTYAEKEKHTLHTYPEKDKHAIHSYAEKDKHTLHGYPEKDKHTLHNYAEKDKHSLHTYTEKDKPSLHAYAGKEKHSLHTYTEKDKLSLHTYTEKDKHSVHTYAEKDKHSLHTYADKDKHSLHMYSEKDKHSFHSYSEKDKHGSHLDKKMEERASQLDALSSNLSKPLEKPTDLSKFQMFKPYSDTPKPHSEESSSYKSKDLSKHHKPIDYKTKEDKHHRSGDISKAVSSMSQDSTGFSAKSFGAPSDYITSRYDSSSKHRTQNSHHHTNIGNELSKIMEDSGVIVKNLQPKEKMGREDKMDHLNPVIPKATHCQGVKRKLLDNYSRNSADITPTNYYPVASNKHAEYSTSTPLVTNKSEGDGQKDIQMVMENLKALQKLSCSPIKNDNSSSSPVSVIAYNKTFTTSKTTTSSSSNHASRNDINSRNEFSGGFQDEFQKQFINSLQQMAANTNNNKSGYNNGS